MVALALTLLEEPEALSLVAEHDGTVVGNVVFSPVAFAGERGRRGYLLAPLGVAPAHQRRGVGTGLVREGLARSHRDGVGVVLVYGDPAYYGRFGFSNETANRFTPPYALTHPFGWQAVLTTDADLPERELAVSCLGPLRDPALW